MPDEPPDKKSQKERQPESWIRDAARQQFATQKVDQVHNTMKNLSPELQAEVDRAKAAGQKDNFTPLPTPISKPDDRENPYRAREPGERKPPEPPPPGKGRSR